MARATSPLEFTSLTGGINTEASPLNFPVDATVDERNFTIGRDGTRKRREGLYFPQSVSNGELVTADTSFKPHLAKTRDYLWKDASGTGEDILVQHIHNLIRFSRLEEAPFNQDILTTIGTYGPQAGAIWSDKTISFATVEGTLLVADGQEAVSTFEYDGTTVSRGDDVIVRVRDFWGVEDVQGPFSGDIYQDYRTEKYLDVRPRDYTGGLTGFSEHMYNLRNQGWAPFRLAYASGTLPQDSIGLFVSATPTTSRYPSNSENPTRFIYANTSVDAKLRYDAGAQWAFPPPKEWIGGGHFIIDAVSRGASRREAVEDYQSRRTADAGNGLTGPLVYSITTTDLPLDRTTKDQFSEGGPTVVGSFAGRAWFAGFSSNIYQGDRHSPALGNYIFFSGVVDSKADLGKCYQVGDPTSIDAPDILDTDGGFIRLSGLGKVLHMEVLGGSLLVFADNGVWEIAGGSEIGFTATAYRVNKITSFGCLSAKSVVKVGSSAMYWSKEGIQIIRDSGGGLFQTANMSDERIKTMYSQIRPESKENATGFFDESEGKVSWIYNTTIESKKLVFDTLLNTYSLFAYAPSNVSESLPRIYGEFLTPSTVHDTSDGTHVAKEQFNSTSALYDVGAQTYAGNCTEGKGDEAILTTAEDFRDWTSHSGMANPPTPIDAEAYLVTGFLTAGDSQRYKQVPFLTLHFNKTETGYEDSGDDFLPKGESSCLVQTQWEWSNSPNSGMWGAKFQGYRHKRHYFPVDVNDPYDNGFSVVTTKNKLRGKGRALSLRLETEAGKDCQLLGYGMVMGVTGGV